MGKLNMIIASNVLSMVLKLFFFKIIYVYFLIGWLIDGKTGKLVEDK